MRVSIVTISFNQGKYIKETIESILGQDYPNLEYIIVDPGSTDGSRDIIRTYADRLAATVFEPDRGPADGLNNGFRRASGDIYGFVNADDTLLPGTISRVVEAFRQNPEADVVYGHGYWIDGSGKIIRRIYSDPFHLKGFAYGCVTFIQPSVFFRKEVYNEAGGFNIENKTSWDGELLARLGLQGKRFLLVPLFLSGFRMHETSISGTGRLTDLYRRDRRRLFEMIVGRSRKWYDSLLAVVLRIQKWMKNPRGLAANMQRVVGLPVGPATKR